MAERTTTSKPELMAPHEVAARFNVDVKTVARWANSGKLKVTRTLGGHRRFYAAEVNELLRAQQ